MTNERGPKRQGSATWLEPLVAALAKPEPLLVLCRSSATARAVYRFLAEQAANGGRKGFPGLRITTPAALFAEAAPKSLVPGEAEESPSELPARHPWKEKLDGRPGLRALLREQMARVHEAALVGMPTAGLKPEIRALLSAGWGTPGHLEGARRLLGRSPGARCLAIGFPPEPFTAMGGISPLVRALLEHLHADPVDSGNPASSPKTPLRAARVPDVAAEARMVAAEATPTGTLVLVASSATAERVRAALARNGSAAADDQSDPLRAHALVALAAPLLPVFFSRGKEPLDAEALLRLLTDPVLSRTAEVPEHEKLYASVKHVREMIVECRRARATVNEWAGLAASLVKDAQEEVDDADEDHREGRERRLASARVLQTQLELLRKHARAGGRLGDLHACLAGIGLSSPDDDRVGHAVLRALRAAAHLPADGESYDAALAGSVGSGRVDCGVEILSYDAYDGRPSERLLLLDVHDKGLARITEPNPFLSAGELQLLGIPAALDGMRERLSIARWAASRSGSTLALVAATDASGRAVSPPVELDLTFDDAHATNAYGLQLELPERRDRLALAEGQGEPDRLSVQVDVEWLRRGAWLAAPGEAKPALEKSAALPEHLERGCDRLPDDLRPWLGEAGAHPDSADGLPAGFVASASRCGAFTSCLYRAFCSSVLGLAVPEEIDEDLNAREIGSAIHVSLGQALEGTSLLVPAAEVDSARKTILRRLRAALSKEAGRLAGEVPGTTHEALDLSRTGLVTRWSRFLGVHVCGRIRDVEEVQFAERSNRLMPVKASKTFNALVDALGTGMKKTPQGYVRSNAFNALCSSGDDVDAFLGDTATWTANLCPANAATIEAALQTKPIKKLAASLCDEAGPSLQATAYHPRGDLEVVRTELPFGAIAGGPPLSIGLGRGSLAVRGFIDLVVRHRGADSSGTTYRIIDFKTGKTMPHVRAVRDQVILPQLALYALALEALGPLERKHAAPARVDRVQLDYVRTGVLPVPVDENQRQRWRQILGQVFDRARDGSFLAVPHPDACPLSRYKGAYCDFGEVCRIRRQSFAEAQPEEATEEAP